MRGYGKSTGRSLSEVSYKVILVAGKDRDKLDVEPHFDRLVVARPLLLVHGLAVIIALSSSTLDTLGLQESPGLSIAPSGKQIVI